MSMLFLARRFCTPENSLFVRLMLSMYLYFIPLLLFYLPMNMLLHFSLADEH